MDILDYDTGGGEFLLSLHHPYARTAATEGYPPNVALCQERLLPLGIQFWACHDSSAIPFEDEVFDLVLNRHGSFYSKELLRILRPGGLFITEQVGAENDRDLVKLVLPEAPKPFPHQTLAEQRHQLENTGFHILQAEEAFRPIRFYDIGAFVWFARIIAWEFPGFSVVRCWAQLLHLQRSLEKNGVLEGTTHRFLLVARKKWVFYPSDADAPCADATAVAAFDAKFPPKEKAWRPSQEIFYIQCHSTVSSEP